MSVFIVTALWFLGGLFGGGEDCHFAEAQGVRTMRQIGEQWPLRSVEDPVSKYVQRLGLHLAQAVDPGLAQPWDFYVLRNTEPSAFAVGGGHFVISDGLIAFVRNEPELAAVLAHEIAHQSLGHFCRRVTPAVERIDRGTVVQHFDLQAEMDADREAIRLLGAARFDPGGMQSVLRSLKRLPGAGGSDLQQRIGAALSGYRVPRAGRANVDLGAFDRAQRSVEADLRSAAHPAPR